MIGQIPTRCRSATSFGPVCDQDSVMEFGFNLQAVRYTHFHSFGECFSRCVFPDSMQRDRQSNTSTLDCRLSAHLLFGRPFVKRFALCYRTVVLSVCPVLSCPICHVCNVGALWPNGWMDQDETLHADRPRTGHIVLDGNPAPPTKKGHTSPQFSAHVCCGQTAEWTKMPLGREVGLGPGDIVLDGDPDPPLPKQCFLVRCFILVLVFV